MTPDELRRRLAALPPDLEAVHGDGTAEDRRLAHAALGRTLRPAAVLMLLTDHGAHGMHLVLTQRTAHLADHAGQISLPGGHIDAEDTSAVAAALREAREEIGADPTHIEVLTTLPTYVTVTAYAITPVVALADRRDWRVDPHEVVDVFEVPLAHLLAGESWRRDCLVRAGRERTYWAVPWQERYIWGATAGMLRTLRSALIAGAVER